jgi:peptidoglycan-associated lipoprotein
MRLRFPVHTLVLLALAAPFGFAQAASTDANTRAREVGLSYDWTHANAPAGGCGCFSMNGAGISAALPLGQKGFAITSEMAIVHQPNVILHGQSLTLGTWLIGARFRPNLAQRHVAPYAEILLGPAHAGGSLAASSSSRFAFASQIGGGMDIRLSRHWAWRAVQTHYLLTTFPNGSNNHQNNLRLGSGLVFRF